MIQLYFRRKHLPSDSIYLGTFNKFHVPSLDQLSADDAERECRAVVDEWNQGPESTDWHYTYVGTCNQVIQWQQENS